MASSTTNDKEIARNPHPSKGLGRDGLISLLLLLDLVSVALPTYVIVFTAGSTSSSERNCEKVTRSKGWRPPVSERSGSVLKR